MTLSIKDPEADMLARKAAKMTGGTMTQAVVEALREKVAREERKRTRKRENLIEQGMAIARHCSSLPVLDDRSPDEILGYDENGLPT